MITKVQVNDPQEFLEKIARLRIIAYRLQNEHDGAPKLYGNDIEAIINSVLEHVDVVEQDF